MKELRVSGRSKCRYTDADTQIQIPVAVPLPVLSNCLFSRKGLCIFIKPTLVSGNLSPGVIFLNFFLIGNVHFDYYYSKAYQLIYIAINIVCFEDLNA